MVVVVVLLLLVFVVDVFVVVVVKTPTQPQHNLTQPEVGFDMIIAVHTPPTHPPKPPLGTLLLLEVKVLKFFMRSHLTKLTTTQHNFNPTIFCVGVGRGGHASYPLA